MFCIPYLRALYLQKKADPNMFIKCLWTDLIGDLRRMAEADDIVGLGGDACVAVDLGAVLYRHDKGRGGGG